MNILKKNKLSHQLKQLSTFNNAINCTSLKINYKLRYFFIQFALNMQ